MVRTGALAAAATASRGSASSHQHHQTHQSYFEGPHTPYDDEQAAGSHGHGTSMNGTSNARPSTSDMTILGRPSESYHGHMRLADSMDDDEGQPLSASEADDRSSDGSSLLSDPDTLPTYSAFKLPHLIFDLPLTVLFLVSFALLSVFGWPHSHTQRFPHRPHWVQVGLGAITWLASETIRRRIWKFFGDSRFSIVRSTPFLLLLHTATLEVLRLFAIYTTLRHHSRADVRTQNLLHASNGPPGNFFRAFDLALGFATAETLWRTLELLGNLKLYADVLEPPVAKAWLVGEENILNTEHREGLRKSNEHPNDAHAVQGPERILDDLDIRSQTSVRAHHDRTDEHTCLLEEDEADEDEFQQLLRERQRNELEASFGCPLWEIPVVIVAIWRLDAILLNLALSLFLSLPFSHFPPKSPSEPHTQLPLRLPLAGTFVFVVCLHWVIGLIWTLGIRARIGMAGISYGTLIVVLGCFFASLAGHVIRCLLPLFLISCCIQKGWICAVMRFPFFLLRPTRKMVQDKHSVQALKLSNGNNGPSISSVEPPHPTPTSATPVPHHLYKRIPKHLMQGDGTPNYLRMILTARVYDILQPTPLTYATQLSTRLGVKIHFKREDLQPVFSFKCRGAYNCIANLSPQDRDKGVVACSAGNHAQGVALACQKLGIKANIVMPLNTPSIKYKNVQRLGSNVILHGNDFDMAKTECARLEKENGWTNIPPYDDPFVIAGQATVATEILRQLEDMESLDAIFVCVGGGGLLAGIATYIKQVAPPHVKVIGVETVDADALAQSLQRGERVMLEEVGLFADGTAVRIVGEECFRLLSSGIVDEMVLVNNDEICAAIKDVFEDTRSVPEPSGALAVAGMKRYIANHKLQGSGKSFVSLVSGANMNFDRLRFVAERAELGEGREALLSVFIPDKPGSFQELVNCIMPRAITEFSFRHSGAEVATIYMSFSLSSAADRSNELNDIIDKVNTTLSKHNESSAKRKYYACDISSNELAKSHARYIIGGRMDVPNERLFRFEFPERPGALKKFLAGLKTGWNISLFHYRSIGGDTGKILTGFQVPKADDAEFASYLKDLDYRFVEETDNFVAKSFLYGEA